MSNLSYCRYRNTLSDLIDCEEALWEEETEPEETRARERLIKVCRRIAELTDDDIKRLPIDKEFEEKI